MKMLKFFNLNEVEIKELIMSVFEDTPWTKAFFSDSHHGYIH
jgi:hypothetical protein